MKITDKISTIIFYFSVILFLIAFNFQDNPPSGWYQQFMPDIGSRQINDITFTDSLTGFAITSISSDTSYILKTTDGGDNWTIIYRAGGFIMNSLQFLDFNTGFVGGTNIIRTTNSGQNWTTITSSVFLQDFYFINNDTAWYVNSNGLTGGVFRTTNGGVNWTQQLNLGSLNPTNVYFYNEDTGFVASNVLYKTTNSGVNWSQISGGTGFGEMYFMNSTTGWKCYGPIQKTTDGGLNWQTLPIPPKNGSILLSRINNMHVLNEDTIWGVGSTITTGSGNRGILYISTNGGQDWGYQLPDSSTINIFQYQYVQFIDKNKGWAFTGNKGVHTVTGGDTTILLGVKQLGSEIPTTFELYQNYPNPFNPETNIKFKVKSSKNVKLAVFDITGREIAVLVNKKLTPGEYQYNFDGSNLTSGIYFYKLETEDFSETKKMLLVK